jgi:hypothetical protein
MASRGIVGQKRYFGVLDIFSAPLRVRKAPGLSTWGRGSPSLSGQPRVSPALRDSS